MESLESLQEEAVDSILLAVAGEDDGSETFASNGHNSSAIQLNSNCNNNITEPSTPDTPGSEFIIADHLLEMAGGEGREERAQQREQRRNEMPSTSRGTVGRNCCEAKAISTQLVSCYVTILPAFEQVESLKVYISRISGESRPAGDLEMELMFVVLQVLTMVFTLYESQQLFDSISTSDFVVITDSDNMSTVHCSALNVCDSGGEQRLGLTCEKLRMFMMQLGHSNDRLAKSTMFSTIDDMIQSASDIGDLKTISAILKYLLWGPKEEEVQIITLSEHRRQAFELWLQLARGKQMNRLAFRPMDKLKIYMMSDFLAKTNGTELFKITKLLNTY